MNFGQALVALLSKRNITCAELGRPGAYLAMQQPAGNITEPFIAEHLANGIVSPWSPTQTAILATNWSVAADAERGAPVPGAVQTVGQHEHAGSSR